MEQRSETRLRYQSERSTFRGRSFGSQNADSDWLKGMQPCLEVSMRAFPFGLGAKKDRGRETGFSALAAREMKREPPRSFTCAIFRAVFDSRSSFVAPFHTRGTITEC